MLQPQQWSHFHRQLLRRSQAPACHCELQRLATLLVQWNYARRSMVYSECTVVYHHLNSPRYFGYSLRRVHLSLRQFWRSCLDHREPQSWFSGRTSLSHCKIKNPFQSNSDTSNVIFEVMMSFILWDITPFGPLKINRLFGIIS
jgi:hypothetical protein